MNKLPYSIRNCKKNKTISVLQIQMSWNCLKEFLNLRTLLLLILLHWMQFRLLQDKRLIMNNSKMKYLQTSKILLLMIYSLKLIVLNPNLRKEVSLKILLYLRLKTKHNYKKHPKKDKKKTKNHKTSNKSR